jgi:hypothetical protein
MIVNRTGFEQTSQGLSITKDTEAQLAYVFDWREWLPDGDALSTVEYEVRARRNDPQPINKIDEGIINSTQTYVELAGGQQDKVYIVNCKITTQNGLIDRRSFRIKVLERSA